MSNRPNYQPNGQGFAYNRGGASGMMNMRPTIAGMGMNPGIPMGNMGNPMGMAMGLGLGTGMVANPAMMMGRGMGMQGQFNNNNNFRGGMRGGGMRGGMMGGGQNNFKRFRADE